MAAPSYSGSIYSYGGPSPVSSCYTTVTIRPTANSIKNLYNATHTAGYSLL